MYDRAILDVTEAIDISNVVVTPIKPPVVTPSVPSNIHVTVGAKLVVITWDVVKGLQHRLNYRVKGTTAWTTIGVSAGRKILALTPKTTYEYQLEAIGKNVASQWSTVAEFTTK